MQALQIGPAVALDPEAFHLLIPGSMVAVACLLRPSWIMPVFLALTWMSIPAWLYGGLPSPVEVGAVVLLAYATWRATRASEVAKPVLMVVALIGFAALGASLASSEAAGIPTSWLGELSFLAIAALAVRDREDLDRVAVALCGSGAFLGLGAMYSILIGPTALFPVGGHLTGVQELRASGPFGEANFFALSMAALGPLAVYMATRRERWRRGLGIFTICALAGGILATGSRGGAIAFGAGLIMAWLALTARRKRIAILAILVVVALLPVFSAQISGSSERTVSGRATENQIAVGMFADRPIAGVGVGEYPALYRTYAREIGNDPRPVRAPHSLPLQIAAEQGLFGIAAWLIAGIAVLGYVLRHGVWRLAIGRAVILSVAAYWIGSLFLQGSQIRLLFILTGLIFAAGAPQPDRVPASVGRLEPAGARAP